MATEPVSSDSSIVLEQVEHETPAKVKTIEESISDDLKAKEEEIPSGVPVPSSESIEKIVEKESKQPIAEEVVNANVEEKLQADESPYLDATSSGPEETKEDKSIEPSPPEDVIVSSLVPVKESSDDHVAEVDKGDVSEGKDDSIESEALPQTENKDLEKLEEETVVDKPEEQANKIEVPETETKEISKETEPSESLDAVAKEEQAKAISKEIEPSESLDAFATEEVQVKELLEKTGIPESLLETSNVGSEQSDTIIPKEPEVTEVKDVESSAADEEKNIDALVSAPGEDLSEEKAKITEELKQELVEAETTDKTEVDAANNEESLADNVEEIKLKSELEPIEAESTKQDNITTELPADIEGKKDEVLDTASDTNKDAEVEKKANAEEPQESGTETKGEDLSEEKAEITDELKGSIEAEATDKLDVDATKDGDSSTDKVEGIELKSEVEPVASESSKQDNIDAEDPLKPDKNNETEDLSKDLKTEDKKEDTPENEESTVPEAKGSSELTSSVPAEAEQTSREIVLPADIEVNKDATLGSTAETEKDVEVEKKVDVEEEEKTSESVESQVEQQKEVEENAKPDAPIEETPKEEVPVKQKNSNNLLSKMKQSLVKAKKAIIKKNPSKTPPTS